MLYDPKWSAAKPDVMSVEGLIHWLEKQPAEMDYSYLSVTDCLLARYFKACGYWGVMCGGKTWNNWTLFSRQLPKDFFGISVGVPCTYGAALKRARAVLSNHNGRV